ncbi:hypothetical protein THAOC_02723 [Thalassiosira oceanica]|uniref:Superoxide dismutase copper/zinc binding domain-containing protein n=1 Tax=Thalassiosira oceanica TaxID=159749 RepID=K0TDM2_THAOC|nr:hypothetical protein THAOC_02723 [Thalassiosira oceanica]|eukprot:EJK75550.1 hypothetical protein THAOC_02723 [Thalassiosira oceanica]
MTKSALVDDRTRVTYSALFRSTCPPSERFGSVGRCVKTRTMLFDEVWFPVPRSHEARAARSCNVVCNLSNSSTLHDFTSSSSHAPPKGVRYSPPLPAAPEGAFAVPFESSTIRKPFVSAPAALCSNKFPHTSVRGLFRKARRASYKIADCLRNRRPEALETEQVDAKLRHSTIRSAHHESENFTEEKTDKDRDVTSIADCSIDECGGAGRADVLSHVSVFLRESLQLGRFDSKERRRDDGVESREETWQSNSSFTKIRSSRLFSRRCSRPSPAKSPTGKPTPDPTSANPTKRPTDEPSVKPSPAPTLPLPTRSPNTEPTTQSPSDRPTSKPTNRPTPEPTPRPMPVPVTDSPVSSKLRVAPAPLTGPTGAVTTKPTVPTLSPPVVDEALALMPAEDRLSCGSCPTPKVPTRVPTRPPTASPTIARDLGTPQAQDVGTKVSPLNVEGADTNYVIRIVGDRASITNPVPGQEPLVVNQIVAQHEGLGRRLLDDKEEEIDSELGLDGGDMKKRRGRRLAEDDTYDRLALQMADLIEARLSGGKESEPKVASYKEEDKEEASRRLKTNSYNRGGKPNSKPTWGGGWKPKPSWGSKPTWNAPAPTPTWGSGTKPTWNAPTSPPTKPPANRSLGRCRVSADRFSVIYNGNGYIGEYRCTYEVIDNFGLTAQADIFLNIVIGPTRSPTKSPTKHPTLSPSLSPTLSPSLSPTLSPSLFPTLGPTLGPTLQPSLIPTEVPTSIPTGMPTLNPSNIPTSSPTESPSDSPTESPPTATFPPSRIGGLTAQPTDRPTRRPIGSAPSPPSPPSPPSTPGPPIPGLPVPAPGPGGKPIYKPWGDGDGGWFWLGHKPGRSSKSGKSGGSSKSGKSKSSKKKDFRDYDYWTGGNYDDDGNEKPDDDNYHEAPIYWGSGGKAGKTKGHGVAPSKCTKSAKSSGKSSKAIEHGTRCLQATINPSNNERYPDIDGYIEVCFDGQLSETSGRLVMQVDNLKADTRGGVHIHSGTSCESAVKQEGHHFKQSSAGVKGDGDPWYPQSDADIAPTGSFYETDASAFGSADYLFDSGLALRGNIGHAVIIHDTIEEDGGDYARVACGILKSTAPKKLKYEGWIISERDNADVDDDDYDDDCDEWNALEDFSDWESAVTSILSNHTSSIAVGDHKPKAGKNSYMAPPTTPVKVEWESHAKSSKSKSAKSWYNESMKSKSAKSWASIILSQKSKSSKSKGSKWFSFSFSSQSKSTKEHTGVVEEVAQEDEEDNGDESFWVPGYVAEALGKGGGKSSKSKDASNDEPVDKLSSQKPSKHHSARSKAVKSGPAGLKSEARGDMPNSLHGVPSMGSATDIRHSEGLAGVEMTPISTDAAESESSSQVLRQSYHILAGIAILVLSLSSNWVWR